MITPESIFSQVADGTLAPEEAEKLLRVAEQSTKEISVEVSDDELSFVALNYLQEKIGEALSIQPSEIDSSLEFMELGLDSTSLIKIAESVETDLGVELYPTLFFEYTSLDDLAGYFAKEHRAAIISYSGNSAPHSALDNSATLKQESVSVKENQLTSKISVDDNTETTFNPPINNNVDLIASSDAEYSIESTSPKQNESDDTKSIALNYFVEKLSAILSVEKDMLDVDENLMDLGIDSTSLIKMADTIEKDLSIELYPSIFFEHTTLNEIADYFAGEHASAFSDMVTDVTSPMPTINAEKNNVIQKKPITDKKASKSSNSFVDNVSVYTHVNRPVKLDDYPLYQPEYLTIYSPTTSLPLEYRNVIADKGIKLEVYENGGSADTSISTCVSEQALDSISKIDENEENRSFLYLVDTDKIRRQDSEALIDVAITDFLRLIPSLAKVNKPQILIYIRGEQIANQMFSQAFTSFLKSLKRELGNTNIGIVSVGPNDRQGQNILDSLRITFKQKETVAVLRCEDNRYYIQNIRRVHENIQTSLKSPFRQGGAFLITGASGKLGMLVARYLAEQCKAKLMLLGRRPINAEIEELIQSCVSLGAEVSYEVCDISNRKNLSDVTDTMRRRYKSIDGVFHVAGLVDDKVLHEKDFDSFKAVISPKISGTLNLDELTRKDPLDFFVCFSSVASFTGNRGQTDYALGNGFMDGAVEYRRVLQEQGFRSGKSIAINWPLWSDGGMQPIAAVRDMMHARLGLESLSSDNGIKVLEWSLQQEFNQFAVFSGNAEKIDSWLLKDNESAQLSDKHIKDASLYAVEAAPMEDPIAEPLVATEAVKTRNQATVQVPSSSPATQAKNLPYIENTDKNLVDKYAVIGMDCRFPGSPDLQSFMDNISAGADLIKPDPDRWSLDNYVDSIDLTLEELDSFEAGFISDVDKFDAGFFNISAAEASYMDPQQRIFMQTAWRAIENAGYNPFSFAGKNIGVFVGASTRDYGVRLSAQARNSDSADDYHPYFSTGLATSNVANRFSHFLDLKGPSQVVDTACSSSLVSMHQAISAIRQGEVEQSIVGGVNLLLVAEIFALFKASGLLSDTSRCRSFAKNANGYVRGEGIGAVLVKPLAKALDDSDHIYGVVLGSAVNHGGKVQSLTAPNPKQQAQVIKTAMERAQINPSRLGYIEAHGTGTALGDSVEIRGLNLAFEDSGEFKRSAKQGDSWCDIGSVKSNIGHLESAAGIAGIIKTLLCLSHRYLPKLVHLEEVNPFLDLKDSPFSLLKTSKVWEPVLDDNGNPMQRCAGVSSFGFGGTNAHVVMEEAPASASLNSTTEKVERCFVTLSAQSEEQLQEYASNLAHWMERQRAENIHPDIRDIAYTMQVGRPAFNHRLVVQTQSNGELVKALHDYASGQKSIHVEYALLDGKTKKNSVLHGKATEVLVQHFIDSGEFHKIARLWLEGLVVDWEAIYKSNNRKRLPLPGYPFKRTSYWIGNQSQKPDGSQLSNESDSRNSSSKSKLAENNSHPEQGNTHYSSEDSNSNEVAEFIYRELEEQLQFDKSTINAATKFSDIALDSIVGMKLLNKLESRFGISLFSAEFSKLSDVGQLVNLVSNELKDIPSSIARNGRSESKGVTGAELGNVPKDPVFLLSSPRSGSTLTRVLLAGSKELFAPPELHLLNYDDLALRDSALGHTGMVEGLIEAISVLEKKPLEDVVNEIKMRTKDASSTRKMYERVMQSAYPKQLIDKSPSYGADLAVLEKSQMWFPNARYLFLMRRPEAVINSLVDNRFHRILAPEATDGWAASAKIWHLINNNIVQFLSSIPSERKLTVYFEELIAHPEKSMRSICRFLNIEYSEEMIKPYSGEKMIHGLTDTSLSIGDPNFLKHENIDSKLATRWADNPIERTLDAEMAGFASELGYDLGPVFNLNKHGNDSKYWHLVQRFEVKGENSISAESITPILEKLYRIHPILRSIPCEKYQQLEVHNEATFKIREVGLDKRGKDVSIDQYTAQFEKDLSERMINEPLCTLGIVLGQEGKNTSYISFVFSHYLLDGYGAILLLTNVLKMIAELPVFGDVPSISLTKHLGAVASSHDRPNSVQNGWSLPDNLLLTKEKQKRNYIQEEICHVLEFDNVLKVSQGLFADAVGSSLCAILKNDFEGEPTIAFRYHGRSSLDSAEFSNALGNFAVDLPLEISSSVTEAKHFAKAREKSKAHLLSSYNVQRINTDLRLNVQEISGIEVGKNRALMCSAYELRSNNKSVNYPIDLIVRKYNSRIVFIARFNRSLIKSKAIDMMLKNWSANLRTLFLN